MPKRIFRGWMFLFSLVGACAEVATPEDVPVETRASSLRGRIGWHLEISASGTIASEGRTAAVQVLLSPSFGDPSLGAQILHTAPGQYDMVLPRVGADDPTVSGQGGTVQVVSKGTSATRCALTTPWRTASNGSLKVHVRCTSAGDVAADSGFYVYFGRAPSSGAGAYGLVLSDGSLPTATSWSSAGSGLSASRTAIGSYVVALPPSSTERGALQITTVDTTATCHVASRVARASGTSLVVECRTATGVLGDAAFAFNYAATDSLPLVGMGAFSEVDGAGNLSLPRSFNACPRGATSVSHLGRGRYAVTHTLLGATRPAYHVSALGAGARSCFVTRTEVASGGASTVVVHCVDAAGAPLDSAFVETYAVQESDCAGCPAGCDGGACLLGVCQPVTLAADVRPTSVGADSTRVFWTEIVTPTAHACVRSVARNPTTSTVVQDVVSTTSTNPVSSIQVGPDRVVWLNQGIGVFAAPKSGGPGQRVGTRGVEVATPQTHALALVGATVYWANTGASQLFALEGGATTPLLSSTVMPDGHNWYPHTLAVTAPYAYFVRDSGGKVGRVPLSGGVGTVVTALPASVPGSASGSGIRESAIVANGSHVFWATSAAPGQIFRAPAAGGDSAVFASGSGVISGLALEGDALFFSDRGGEIKSIPVGGGATVTLATGEDAPNAIWVDARSVIWSTSTSVRQLVR